MTKIATIITGLLTIMMVAIAPALHSTLSKPEKVAMPPAGYAYACLYLFESKRSASTLVSAMVSSCLLSRQGLDFDTLSIQ